MSDTDSSPGGRRSSFLFAKRRKKSDVGGADSERSSGAKKRPASMIAKSERKKRRSRKDSIENSVEEGAEEELGSGTGGVEVSSSIAIPQKLDDVSGGSGSEFAKAAKSSPSTKGFISGITKMAKKEKKAKSGRAKYKHRSSEDNRSIFNSRPEPRRRSNTHAVAHGAADLDKALLLALKHDKEAEMPTMEEMRKAEELLNTLDSPRVVSRRDHNRGSVPTLEAVQESAPKVGEMYDIAFQLDATVTSPAADASEAAESPSRHTLSSGYIDAKLAQGLLTEAEAQTLLMTTPRTLPVGVLDAVLRFETKRDKQLIKAKLSSTGSPRSLEFSPRSPRGFLSSDDFADMYNDGHLVSLDTLCDMSGLEDAQEDDDLLLSDPDSTEEELSKSASGQASACLSERDDLDRDPIMDISEPSSYGDELERVESLAAAVRENNKRDREEKVGDANRAGASAKLCEEEDCNRVQKEEEGGEELSKETRRKLLPVEPNEASSYDMEISDEVLAGGVEGRGEPGGGDQGGGDQGGRGGGGGGGANDSPRTSGAQSDSRGDPLEGEREGKEEEELLEHGEEPFVDKKSQRGHQKKPRRSKKLRKERREKKEKKERKVAREKKERKEKRSQRSKDELCSNATDDGHVEVLDDSEEKKEMDPRSRFQAGTSEMGIGAAMLSSPSLLVSVPVHEVVPDRAPDLEMDLEDLEAPKTLPLVRTPSGTVIDSKKLQIGARVEVQRLGLQQRPAEPSESELELSMGECLECSPIGVVAKRTESFTNLIEASESSKSPPLSSPKKDTFTSRREGRLPLARRWEMMLKSNIEQADTRVQRQKESREEKLKHEMEQERLRMEALKGGLQYDPKEASAPSCSPTKTEPRRTASSPMVAGRIQMFESLSDAIDEALSAHRRLKSECAKSPLNEVQAEIAANALGLLTEAAVHLQLLRDAAK